MAGVNLAAGRPPVAVRAKRRRKAPGPIIGLCFGLVGAIVVMALFGPLLVPHDPDAQNLGDIMAMPSGQHWLGTDILGRDTFSRVITGARSAFLGPLAIAVGSFVLGNGLGLLAGYRGGRVDALIMRWVDFMWAIPALLVLIVAVGAVGAGYWPTVAILMVLTVPLDTRVVRGATLEQVPRPYVEAAKTLGVPDRRIMLLHIWPNVSPVSVANSFLVFASSLGVLAAMSFLGLGVPPGAPDWGLMLSESQALLFDNPIAALAPGLMIVLTATSTNLIGDWLYERLSNRGTR
ncbi:ABC transporter permease [Nonomuraea sp. PA05]|uniref:ABC transporter permease n=1 Tax=Nonomuraea sp. PA05 TaxID=2604466 RepID=UPI0011DABB86|nr:ABC transporter permease [Nonomuraea sp. PA05]TYB57423.1 ABC transporter permease [Nonomuraea sp. PA05]